MMVTIVRAWARIALLLALLIPAGVAEAVTPAAPPLTVQTVSPFGHGGRFETVQQVFISLTVNSTGDTPDASPGDGTCETAPGNGVCSLRAAIQEANARAGAKLIAVPPGTYRLAIPGTGEDAAATGDLDVRGDVGIIGPSTGRAIVDGGGLDRVFDVPPNSRVVLGALTIQSGTSGDVGGAIRSRGQLTVLNTTVVGNTAATFGAGIDSAGSLSMTNVTIANNRAGSAGGAIATTGSASITNSTLTGNVANVATSVAAGAGSTARLRNTILAGAFPDRNCVGPITSLGGNLESGGTCGLIGPGDQSHVDPGLAPLADNGGTTDTQAPLPGSPAVDRGSNDGCPSSDQRGAGRPVDGDGNGSAICDVGAVEAGSSARPRPSCEPRPPVSVTATPDGAGRLRVRVVATPGPGAPDNRVQAITVDYTRNAVVDINDQVGRTGTFTVQVPGLPREFVFYVRRGPADDATTVSFKVVDDCGFNPWQSLVGGGRTAF